jgi:hypothetical protein
VAGWAWLARTAESAEPVSIPDADASPLLSGPAVDRVPAGAQAVELDRVVPPSGHLWLAGQQIWPGSAMTGRIVRLRAGLDQVYMTRPLTTADGDGRPGGSIMLGSQALWSMAHCASRRMALRGRARSRHLPSKS